MMMKLKILIGAILCLCFVYWMPLKKSGAVCYRSSSHRANKRVQESDAYTDAELMAIRNGYDKRVDDAFKAELSKPFKKVDMLPPLDKGRAPFVRDYSFSLIEYATSCLWLNQKVDTANVLLLENADYYIKNPRSVYDRDNFHWQSEMLLRLIELFGQKGKKHQGLLKPKTENAIMEAAWLYCKRKQEDQTEFTQLAKADDAISNTWYISESENHHVQSFSTQWHFAKLAKNLPDFKDRLYDDGKKAIDHYNTWNTYIKKYLTERSKKGMLIEMMAIGYNEVLLKGIFNFYDFAEDPELRKKTGLYLDLYFTYWGQEQLDGVSGGGKARIYVDLAPKPSEMGYYFFGIGRPNGLHSINIAAMTSGYRPPLVVVDIACDVKGRGVYEVLQRPLGLADKGYNSPPVYHMRTDSGGIARYSYCTPDFIMGTAMSMARPKGDWSAISSQNRSNGVIFAGNHNAGILPECEIQAGSRVAFNTQWSVQRKGTLICQKNKYSDMALHMRVWFATEGLSTPIEDRGWIFAEAKGAYAAVKVVSGRYSWKMPVTKNKGKWLFCENEYSPVIVEAARKADYQSFKDFRDKVTSRPLSFKDSVLSYTGIYGDTFTFSSDFSKAPLINNVPVNYAPEMALNSPFLKAGWNSGIVYIQKGVRKAVLNFND